MFEGNRMAALKSFDTDTYFKALFTVAKADGKIEEAELAFLKDQANLMNYDLDPVLDKDINISDLNIGNTTTFTKKVIIRDCISLAYVDEKYDDKEKAEIINIGKIIGISKDEIEKIENWLFEYWKIIEKGEILLTS